MQMLERGIGGLHGNPKYSAVALASNGVFAKYTRTI